MRMVPLLALAAAALLAAPSAAQLTLFQDGFEAGLGNWSATGLWNLEAASDPCDALQAPFPEGVQAAYFGIDGQCDYDPPPPNAPFGILTLATPVSLPASGPRATLRFRYVLSIEGCSPDCDICCFDHANVRVNGQGVFAGCYYCHGTVGPGWHEFAADLTPWLGQDVVVSFHFSVQDSLFNNLYGWLVDDVRIELEAGVASCASPCPCGNEVAAPPVGACSIGGCSNPWSGFDAIVGCENSRGTGGLLRGHGSPSVSQDSLVLVASGLPPSTTVLFFQGTAREIAFLGDGLRCAGGTITRILGAHATGGVAIAPGPVSPGIAALGQVPSLGAARVYQAFYRDTPSFCTPAGFNLTNAYTVEWRP